MSKREAIIYILVLAAVLALYALTVRHWVGQAVGDTEYVQVSPTPCVESCVVPLHDTVEGKVLQPAGTFNGQL